METEERLAYDATHEPSKSRSPKPAKPVWIWEVQFDANSNRILNELWSNRRESSPELIHVGEFHCTLLYVGGGSDIEMSRRFPHVGGPSEVGRLRDELANREGMGVVVEV